MTQSGSVIILRLLFIIRYMSVLDCHYSNDSIEYALMNWEYEIPFGDSFRQSSVNHAIMAYDCDTDTIWTIGGYSVSHDLYSYHVSSNTLKYYNLSIINQHVDLNHAWCTTNAVIINNTMYFLNTYRVISMELKEPFFWNIIIDSDVYPAEGCLVTNRNQTKLYITSTYFETRSMLIYYLESMTYIKIQTQLQYDHVSGSAVLTSDDILYLIEGGDTLNNNYTEYVNVNDLEDNHSTAWNVIHTFSSGLTAHHGLIMDNNEENVYIVGGAETNKSVHRLNIINNTWQKLDIELPFAVDRTPLLYPVKNKIYSLRSLSDQIIRSKIDIHDPIRTASPTSVPTISPITFSPTTLPTDVPTTDPTNILTDNPTNVPTDNPTKFPSDVPTKYPTKDPTGVPTSYPTSNPTIDPTRTPSERATQTIVADQGQSSELGKNYTTTLSKSESKTVDDVGLTLEYWIFIVILILIAIVCIVICGYMIKIYRYRKMKDKGTMIEIHTKGNQPTAKSGTVTETKRPMDLDGEKDTGEGDDKCDPVAIEYIEDENSSSSADASVNDMYETNQTIGQTPTKGAITNIGSV